MCLAIPSKIIKIDHMNATVDVHGARRDVSLLVMHEDVRVGDYVLVHAGFAIQKVDKEHSEGGLSMHEASIAMSLLDTLISRCREEGYSSVDSVRLRIGTASGILPQALSLAFDAAKANTIAGNARLLIDIVPLRGHCNACLNDFDSESQYILNCPECGSSSFKITEGYEIDILEIEVN